MSVQAAPTTEQQFQWYRWFAHLSQREKARVVKKLSEQSEDEKV